MIKAVNGYGEPAFKATYVDEELFVCRPENIDIYLKRIIWDFVRQFGCSITPHTPTALS